MKLPTAVVLSLLVAGLAPLGTGCAAEDDAGGTTRAHNPQNPSTNTIGPGAGVGAAPRDMPGGGRGSVGPHSKQ